MAGEVNMPQVFREQLDYYIAPRDKDGYYTGFYVPQEIWDEYVDARSQYQARMNRSSYTRQQIYLNRYWEAKRKIRDEYEGAES